MHFSIKMDQMLLCVFLFQYQSKVIDGVSFT